MSLFFISAPLHRHLVISVMFTFYDNGLISALISLKDSSRLNESASFVGFSYYPIFFTHVFGVLMTTDAMHCRDDVDECRLIEAFDRYLHSAGTHTIIEVTF